MLPLLSLHALVAHRGDGLRPELLALLERQRNPDTGLSARIEPDGEERSCEIERIGNQSANDRLASPVAPEHWFALD